MLNLQKILRRTAISFVFLSALGAVAQATEIQFNDDISSASMAALINKVAASASVGDRNITVHLNSGGGDLVAALRAAQSLKRYGVNTSASNDCSSACTVLFSAGAVRTASSGTTFMSGSGRARVAGPAGATSSMTPARRPSGDRNRVCAGCRG